MRVSQLLLSTQKETPADAEIVSHQLMLRAGMINRLASGLYSWMPLGLRVLQKVEAIVREEMNRSGAQEVLMPCVQPAELWEESGRWNKYGPLLLRLEDRHQRSFCFGPTHEEVITDLVRNTVHSYKQLPLNLYQIQTKFRDETRPRFGVMRAREFVMKDAYSFHIDDASLDAMYDNMHQTYCRIFDRIGLDYRPVAADSGDIGGNASHEFHVLADSGEDAIAFSDGSDYAANIELAETLPPAQPRSNPQRQMDRVATPGAHSVEEVSETLGVPSHAIVKTLLVKGQEHDAVALLIRGDHDLNEIKAEKLDAVAEPLEFVDAATVQRLVGCSPGSLGPLKLELPIIADHSVLAMSDFVCGATEDGYHLSSVNWQRDVPEPVGADLRNIVAGDPSPDGKGRISIQRGIEVGHIFKLGKTYSDALQADVLDEAGRKCIVTMGCYGIGVSRVVAAAIEQNHDQNGIVWPESIAPFQVALVPLNLHKSYRVQQVTESLYQSLIDAGIEVLLDDRKERPGVKFADMELIGIPHRLVIADKKLDEDTIEYKSRRNGEMSDIAIDDVVGFIQARTQA